jgi:hypothetical protein
VQLNAGRGACVVVLVTCAKRRPIFTAVQYLGWVACEASGWGHGVQGWTAAAGVQTEA